MTDYKALSDKLRKASSNFSESEPVCNLLAEAANAVNDLFNAASSMHEWIFLNTADEAESLAGDNTMWSDANGDLTVEYRSN